MRNVRRRASFWALVVALVGGSGCDRSEVEALNLAQQGDEMLKTDLEGAISKYEQATKLHDRNPLLFHKLASAYEKKEAWDKVAAAMATASRLRPKNATYFYKRGKALAMQAEKGPTAWSEAREPLEKCIAADPNYDDCYFLLGEVMLRVDDEQRALENYTKAIQHDPQELTYYAPLADLYLNLGFYDQAAAVLKEGQGFAAPGKVGVYSLHERTAAVLQAKGDTNAMVGELEKARRADPEGQHPEVLFSLGSAYAVQKPPNRQQALQMLKTFQSLGCKGAKAQTLKPQCEQAQALVADLQKS
jgi:tetratricopeptide (TPR) repeat protein